MKLSVFIGVLLPTVSAFVVPSFAPSSGTISSRKSVSPSVAVPLRMTATESDSAWSFNSLWQDMLGARSQAQIKVDTTASQVYAELRRKVLIKKERQCLEGQLCSLLRITGDNLSPKVEEHVRRLTTELEAMQANANVFGRDKLGLAGSWKLIYSSAKSHKCTDIHGSVEDISYVSENYRISHSDAGVLRVYKRIRPAAAASTASKAEASQQSSRAA